MSSASETKALYIVVNAGFSDEVMTMARAIGAKGGTIINARGTAGIRKSIMGISVDSEKEIILILIDGETAKKIMDIIKEKMGTHSPAQGICYTLPVDRTTIINNFSPNTDQ